MQKQGHRTIFLYKQKPHVGTDILREAVKNIREEIIRLGGEVRFNSQMYDMNIRSMPGGAALSSILIKQIDDEGKYCGEETMGMWTGCARTRPQCQRHIPNAQRKGDLHAAETVFNRCQN